METLIDVKSICKEYYLARETRGLGQWCKQLINPQYASFQALDSISFTVQKGAAVGFIGPNGAGKSSLIKILCGIQKPSSGSVSVLGFDPGRREKAFLSQIGVVFGHKTSLWWDLPVKNSLETYKKIYGVNDRDYRSRLEELTEALNLGRVLNKPVRNLSLGERVKCELTLNLLHAPKLIFLDEPTVGLDVTSKFESRKYLNFKRQAGDLSVFLTSHDLGDIECCCDDALIVNKGTVRFDGSLSELSAKFKANIKLSVSVIDPAQSELGLRQFKSMMGGFKNISVLQEGANLTIYLVPRASLGSIFDMFQEGAYELEVSPMDFETNVVHLFKTWSRE